MKKIKKLVSFFLITTLLLFIGVSTASAAFDDADVEETADTANTVTTSSQLSNYASNVDPLAKPYAELIAKNMPLLFALGGICLLLWDGFWTARDKKKNKLEKAAEHKSNLQWSVEILGWTLIAVSVFKALVNSKLVGIF